MLGTLDLVFNSHPFKKETKNLWLNFIQTYLLSIWLEQNSNIFTVIYKERDIQSFPTFTSIGKLV